METVPLISMVHSEDEHKEWIDTYDDSSSGYESTDTWDSDSLTSRDSNGDSESLCDLEEDFVGSCKIKTNEVKIFSPSSVSDTMKLILAMPDMCDVTFLVGPDEAPIYGLTAVLSARSRIFQQLIYKHLHMRTEKKTKNKKSSKSSSQQTTLGLTERLVIPVCKYDAEVFRMLIQFVHTGTAYITQQNVSGLICGAVQFELQELADSCWEFVNNCLISGIGESLLEPTRAYSQHETTRHIFDKIYAVLDERFVASAKTETPRRKETSV